MPRMRIAHIVYSFGIGGTENGIVNLINHSHANDADFFICSFSQDADSMTRIKGRRAVFKYFHKRDGNDLLLPVRLARFFREQEINIVHTHGWGTYLEGLISARLARAPVFVHGEHGLDLLTKRRRILMYKLLARATDRILTVSEDLRRRFVDKYGLPGERVKSIVNGVDRLRFRPDPYSRSILRRELGFNEKHVVIGTVGRLSFEKDYQTLVRAFARMAAGREHLRLILVGEGPRRHELNDLVNELHLNESVLILGARDDVPQLMNALDIFALISFTEGMPNTVLEAMSVGLPIIASNVGGVPELVTNGENGLLVEADNVEKLAAAFAQLVGSPRERMRMGQAGHSRVETEFGLDKMVESYDRTYKSLLRRKGIASHDNKRVRAECVAS